MTQHTRLPPSYCPTCAVELDCATPAEVDATPRDGDLTVCMYCGAVLIFTAELRQRPATPAELDSLPPKTRSLVDKVRAAIALYARLN
jgi:hypothetical protein